MAGFYCAMGTAITLIVTAALTENGASGTRVASMAFGGVALAVLAVVMVGATYQS